MKKTTDGETKEYLIHQIFKKHSLDFKDRYLSVGGKYHGNSTENIGDTAQNHVKFILMKNAANIIWCMR